MMSVPSSNFFGSVKLPSAWYSCVQYLVVTSGLMEDFEKFRLNSGIRNKLYFFSLSKEIPVPTAILLLLLMFFRSLTKLVYLLLVMSVCSRTVNAGFLDFLL